MTRDRRKKQRASAEQWRDERWILDIQTMALIVGVVYLLRPRARLHFNNVSDSFNTIVGLSISFRISP